MSLRATVKEHEFMFFGVKRFVDRSVRDSLISVQLFKKVICISPSCLSVLFADSPSLNRETSTSKTIYSSLGSNEDFTLNCVFDGFPVPRVRFKKMGVELNNSGITYGPGSASFKFSVKSENDFGFYTCEATNHRGSASHFIEVYRTSI